MFPPINRVTRSQCGPHPPFGVRITPGCVRQVRQNGVQLGRLRWETKWRWPGGVPDDLLGAVDAAVNAGASVVSMSWGSAEFGRQVGYDSHFKKPGVTFVASSGGSGESTGVEWPAVSQKGIRVGGTSLYLDASGNRTAPEVAWSGSGEGIRTINPLPAEVRGSSAVGHMAQHGVLTIGNPGPCHRV